VPKIASKAKRLRIYIGESDRWNHRPTFQAIVEKAKELDCPARACVEVARLPKDALVEIEVIAICR